MKLQGKGILISGASSGVGAAIARAAAKAGAAEVRLLAREEVRLRAVAADVEALGGRGICHPIDLSDRPAVEALTISIDAESGAPDILINNAGIGRWRFLHESSAEEIEQAMTVPYLAAAWLTGAFLSGMLARGSGQIVNISSVASRMAWPGTTAFVAACRAMRGLSDALRADLLDSAVGVTHYESGPIDTPFWRNNPGSRERLPGIARLLLPVLSPERVAEAVIKGIEGERRFVVEPGILRLVYAVHAIAPWSIQSLMTRTGYRLSG